MFVRLKNEQIEKYDQTFPLRKKTLLTTEPESCLEILHSDNLATQDKLITVTKQLWNIIKAANGWILRFICACGLAANGLIDSKWVMSRTDKVGASISQRVALVSGNRERRQFVELGVKQRLQSGRRWVRGVKQVEDLWTCWPELRHCRINRKLSNYL